MENAPQNYVQQSKQSETALEIQRQPYKNAHSPLIKFLTPSTRWPSTSRVPGVLLTCPGSPPHVPPESSRAPGVLHCSPPESAATGQRTGSANQRRR